MTETLLDRQHVIRAFSLQVLEDSALFVHEVLWNYVDYEVSCTGLHDATPACGRMLGTRGMANGIRAFVAQGICNQYARGAPLPSVNT